MHTIYEWLLHNTENQGNYYTILNSHHTALPNQKEVITAMARGPEFNVVHLYIYPGSSDDSVTKDWYTAHKLLQKYAFADPNAVIDYLATGQIPESMPAQNSGGIQLLLGTSQSEAGAISFEQ